jgi:hypothetical protein
MIGWGGEEVPSGQWESAMQSATVTNEYAISAFVANELSG